MEGYAAVMRQRHPEFRYTVIFGDDPIPPQNDHVITHEQIFGTSTEPGTPSSDAEQE
jgi:hypothetical protein